MNRQSLWLCATRGCAIGAVLLSLSAHAETRTGGDTISVMEDGAEPEALINTLELPRHTAAVEERRAIRDPQGRLLRPLSEGGVRPDVDESIRDTAGHNRREEGVAPAAAMKHE